MATHNASGTARPCFNTSTMSAKTKTPMERFTEALEDPDNKHLTGMFMVGGLTRLYEDYDLISQGIAMAEECMANGDKIQGESPATIIKNSKAEQDKVREFIEVAMKASSIEFEVESIDDEPEGENPK